MTLHSAKILVNSLPALILKKEENRIETLPDVRTDARKQQIASESCALAGAIIQNWQAGAISWSNIQAENVQALTEKGFECSKKCNENLIAYRGKAPQEWVIKWDPQLGNCSSAQESLP